MNHNAAPAAYSHQETSKAFENIFSNIESKLSEFEDVKKAVPIEKDSFFIKDIKNAKDNINTALQTSEILSNQRERETQLLDQWIRIVKIQKEAFESNEVADQDFTLPSFFKNYNNNTNQLETLSKDLCNILRDILTHKETPEATRLSQIYKKANDDYKHQCDLLEQMLYDVYRTQSKVNMLINENCSLSTRILELQEYTNAFSDTNSYDAIQKAKKIKLARELAQKKETIMNKQIEVMQHEMDVIRNHQESYTVIKKQIYRNEKEYRKKIGNYEKEMMELKQEISDLSQNSTSLFESLDKDLQNARNAQLSNEKNLTENQFNQIKMIQERLLTKFQKDESDSARNIETILKNSQQDPVSPLTIDQQNSISRRKAIFGTLINELREISESSQKVKTTDFENQMKIIRNDQQKKSTALKSYLSRMKADLNYRESEIATVKSQCLLFEDLTFDIMEIAIKLIGEYETEERINERVMRRAEIQKYNNFISKGDFITRKLEIFMNNRIETAKEQLIVDGSFNSRPNSSHSRIPKDNENNKEVIKASHQFTRYNYETRVEMKKKQKVRIPILFNRRGPVTESDLQPDEFEVSLSSIKDNTFVISDGKVGYMKDGKFVEVDPSQYEGQSGYFKDGVFIPFDPEQGLPDDLPDGTFVIINGQAGYIKDGKFVPCDPSKGVIPDGTEAIMNGVEGVYIDGKFVPNENQNGVFIDGKFVPLDSIDPKSIKDGTVAIVNGKKGIFKDGVFVPFDNEKLKNILPPGAELTTVDGKLGYFDKDGNFVEVNPNDVIQNENQNSIPKNGIFINGKFVPIDPEKGIPDNIPDGTFGVINGQPGVFKDGKFIPTKNGYIDENGNFVEFNEEDGIPPNLADGTVIVYKGKVGKIIDGKFVPDEEDENENSNSIPKNGIFINGKFVPIDPEKGIPDNIPDGTFGVINGQPGVFKDGKFIPTKNGYIDENGNFVEFNEEDGIPPNLADGTIIVYKGKVGKIIDGKFVPDDDEEGTEEDGSSKVCGYFDENGTFHPFDNNADIEQLLSTLPDGTAIILNGVTGYIKDGKFVAADASELSIPQNGYFTKDGRFVPFDPENGIPDDIPDGTVAIINGQLGVFKDGKFIPNKSDNDSNDHKAGYFDANGNFIPFNPDDGIPNVPDGTIGIVNGHRGIFKNGKFIPFEGNIFPDEKVPNGYYDDDGNFITFDGDEIPFDQIPNGAVGFYNGRKGIFKDGQFIPLTDEQLQQAGNGYFDEDGNFIPIDPDATDFSGIPDGTFGIINGQQGIFKNGQFVPFKPINGINGQRGGIGRPGYIDDNGNFVPMDPNDPNFPAGKKVVFMMNDGTIITQDMMRKLYPGLRDKDIYNRLRFGRFRKHSITPYRKCEDDDSCDYEWFSKCPREDPDWVPDPLYRIQPLKVPNRNSGLFKKKKPKPKPELTPEQLRAIIASSPYVQFDPETAAKFMGGRLESGQFFGACNFKKGAKDGGEGGEVLKTPRRGRALATGRENGRRKQKVSKSVQPQKDSLFFVKGVDNKLGRSANQPWMSNDEAEDSESRKFAKSAYQKMRSRLNARASIAREMDAPPLDEFQRRMLSPDPTRKAQKKFVGKQKMRIDNYKSYSVETDADQSDSLRMPLAPAASSDNLKPSFSLPTNNDNDFMGDRMNSPRRLIDVHGPKLVRPSDKKNAVNKPRSPRSPRYPLPSFNDNVD